MVIPGGARVPLGGTYLEVEPGKRLVMGMNVPGRDEPVLMNLDLAADGDRTEITLSQTFDGAEERDQAEQGSNMLLDGLTTFLATPEVEGRDIHSGPRPSAPHAPRSTP